MPNEIPVVILAGGFGMRIRDYSEVLPKALIDIGDFPIIHHVMKIYAHHGFRRFIICLGYKGDMIKGYFYNLHLKNKDLRILTRDPSKKVSSTAVDDFDITFVDTGLNTPTGGRLKKIESYIDTDYFFATYCDGVADIEIPSLLKRHLSNGKIATLTAIHPMSSFGILEVESGFVRSFKEKPNLQGFVNGGFFVFDKKFFDYLKEDSILEEEPLRKVTEDGQLSAYVHEGFWACMDTQKDAERLNKLWETGVMPNIGINLGKAPWKVW